MKPKNAIKSQGSWRLAMTRIGLAVLALVASRSRAEEFVIPMPSFFGECAYGVMRGPVGFDLGTTLKTVSVMRVTVEGVHSNGWWDGRDIVDFYHGPRGGWLGVGVNYPAWTSTVFLDSDGYFIATNTLYSFSGDWSFLADGIGDFSIEQRMQPAIGADGGFSIPPTIGINSITLCIEADRNIWITQFSTNGFLAWTPTSKKGVTRIEHAASPTGNWEWISSTAASNTTVGLELPPGNAGFLRARHSINP